MKALHRYLFVPFALVLSACDSEETKTPANIPADAAAEYLELREAEETACRMILDDDELDDDYHAMAEAQLELLEEYGRSGDARLRAKGTGCTLLHLAVQHRKEALVRELLKQGADPNATMNMSFEEQRIEETDPVITGACMFQGTVAPVPEGDAATSIRLIDTLVAAGAELKGAPGGHCLVCCAFFNMRRPEMEDVYLHLLKLGANPFEGYGKLRFQATADLAGQLMRLGWTRALAAHIEAGTMPADLRDREEKTLLFAQVEQLFLTLRKWETHAGGSGESTADALKEDDEEARRALAVIKMLLEHGADANAPQGGGWTPMTYAALQSLGEPRSKADTTPTDHYRFALLALLLRHGGDEDACLPNRKETVRDCLPQIVIPEQPQPEATPQP